MNGIIYMHTFPDGKRYIGQTTIPMTRRTRKGIGYRTSPKIREHIQRFGWQSVKTEILYSNIPVNELRRYETLCIDRYNTYLDGLNSDRGKGHVSKQTRQKQSESARKQRKTTSQRSRKYWDDPENRKAQSQRIRKQWDTPKRREAQAERIRNNSKLREANRERWALWHERKRKASTIIAYAFYHRVLHFMKTVERKDWDTVSDFTNSEQLVLF